MQKEVPYNKAIGLRHPEQVVIGIAKDKTGKCNPITLNWTMMTSGNPPMMAISIGLTRYSLEVFKNAKEFVISMPAENQEEKTMFFGTKSGRDCDKFAEMNTQVQPGSKVDCLIMSDAVANFECKKVSELQTGDHVIFVGRIICSHMNPDKPNRLYTVATGHVMGGLARR